MSRHALVSITSSVEKESGSLNLVQLHMKLKGNCPPRFSLFQRYHRWGGSDNKHLFLTFLEAGVSKLNAPADSSVWWGSVSWFIKHWLPSCLHKAVKARELSGSPEGKGSEVKWSCSVVSDSLQPRGLQPTRLLRPWDSPGKNTGVGCHFLLWGDKSH